MDDSNLSADEVAGLIGCTKAMTLRYAHQGDIPIAKRIGRVLLFDRNEVLAVVRTWKLQRIPPRKRLSK